MNHFYIIAYNFMNWQLFLSYSMTVSEKQSYNDTIKYLQPSYLLVKFVLLYGCKTWLVTKEIQRKLQTFVNRCLRYILRIWWPKIISNKDLWKVTRQEDINVKIRKRKFRWIGHTLRKDGEIPTSALFWNSQGNRKRGRPRNSWRRSVNKEAGRSWNELRFLAADKQKWKGLIDNLCS